MSYLLARDTVNGAEGTVVITQNGNHITVANMKNIKANADIQSEDMRVIGTRVIQTKTNGAKLTGTANVYYGSDMFRDMARQYINTGVMPPFDIQITNNDKSTTLGSEVSAYYGCTLTGTIPLAILDDEEAMLNYDFNFAYTSTAKLKSFNEPAQLGN